jgi:transcriptional regulator with XRE-family HTH domain
MAEDRYLYELKEFGKRLCSIRKQRIMAQVDIETRTGFNNDGICKAEIGLKNIKFYTIVKFGGPLEKELADFLKKITPYCKRRYWG